MRRDAIVDLPQPATARPVSASQVADVSMPSGARRAGRREYGIFLGALGVVGLHVVDDNYLQPEPGTSPLDHLSSGLVPFAALLVVAALYPRLRAGARAWLSMTLGTLALFVGAPGAYDVADGRASGDDFTGLLVVAAGIVLLAAGPVILWRSRKGGARRRRYVRRSLLAVAAVAIAYATFWVVVFPIGFPYAYVHIGQAKTDPDLGIPVERVTVRTSDSLELAATYVPSKNRAAVIVFPGATRVEEAKMIARHGYGVLLLEPRGQGSSEGDNVRWAGDRDLIAAAGYLRTRPDVDQGRIGAIGFSIGGEILIEAAAQSQAIKAVVSEGAGERVGEADASGAARILTAPTMAVMTAAMTVFQNHGPPPPIVARIGLISPRPVFLIYAVPGQGGEASRQPRYFAAAGEPKEIWRVPGAGHTGGIDARPAEYERRVIGFFDRTLLSRE
jgi:alpha-beta hydrolase superfamily lysophospholipase